jgi:hypothetical protein
MCHVTLYFRVHPSLYREILARAKTLLTFPPERGLAAKTMSGNAIEYKTTKKKDNWCKLSVR